MTTIKLKTGTTVPLDTDLIVGEVAINTLTGVAYTKKGDGTVVPIGSASSGNWGDIQGTLADQTDLQLELDSKYSASNPNGYIQEANTDGFTYGRRSGQWEAVLPLTGGTMFDSAEVIIPTSTHTANLSSTGLELEIIADPTKGSFVQAENISVFSDTKIAQVSADGFAITDIGSTSTLSIGSTGITFPDSTVQTTAATSPDLTGYATETWVDTNYVEKSDPSIVALNTSFTPQSAQATATFDLTFTDGFVGGDVTISLTVASPVGHYDGYAVFLDDTFPVGYTQSTNPNSITIGCGASNMQDALSALSNGVNGWAVYGSGSPYAPSGVLQLSVIVNTPPVSINTNSGLKFLFREGLLPEIGRQAREVGQTNAFITVGADGYADWTSLSGYATTANLSSYALLGGANFQGKVGTVSSTALQAGFNIGASGVAPNSPFAGDLWMTSGGNYLYYRSPTAQTLSVVTHQLTNTFSAPQIIDTTSASLPALRITQKGTGNTFVVEDATNPDTTALVIDNAGNVGIGVNPATFTATQKLEVQGNIKFSDSTVQSTAFTTAQLPTSATNASARQNANSTNFITPASAHWMMMNPSIVNIERAGFTITNTGTIAVNQQGWISSYTRLGTAGACSSRWRTFGLSQVDQVWAMSDRNNPQSYFNFSLPVHLSGRTCIFDPTETMVTWGFQHGKAETDAVGDLARRGIGWKVTGGAGSRYLILHAHNGTTLTATTSSFAVTALVAFDWDLLSNGSGSCSLYVNGALVASSTGGPTGTTNITPVLWNEEVSTSSASSNIYNGMAHSRGRMICFN